MPKSSAKTLSRHSSHQFITLFNCKRFQETLQFEDIRSVILCLPKSGTIGRLVEHDLPPVLRLIFELHSPNQVPKDIPVDERAGVDGDYVDFWVFCGMAEEKLLDLAQGIAGSSSDSDRGGSLGGIS